MCGLGEDWANGIKSLADHQQSVKYKSATIKTLWPARKATSSKDRWIGAYSIGLTILGKQGCQIKKKKFVFLWQWDIFGQRMMDGW